ncbi:serine aminopeptidase domain-containing protein [Escherichia coli]|uniref:serine aminopeptidase domain-containing protein n=1 Tax=Escherichia coli TaxID=562 RepID=UPI002543014D|nr:alpha/beta hydrolase [Escherichia coli]
MENSRIPGEHFFTTSDNTALFYRHWPALQPGAKKVIVLFHRGHEHSGRLQHLVDELAMPDTAFYAWDARGHGKTSGPRGYCNQVNHLIPTRVLVKGGEITCKILK